MATAQPSVEWFNAIRRLLQDYVTTPRLMGRKLELHPLAVIFAVLVGADRWCHRDISFHPSGSGFAYRMETLATHIGAAHYQGGMKTALGARLVAIPGFDPDFGLEKRIS